MQPHDTTDQVPQIIPLPTNQTKNFTGKVFGRLTVIGYVGKNKHGQSNWLCHCKCGEHCIVCRTSLVAGRTNSCGCLSAEALHQRNLKHGMIKSKEYRCWAAIVNRCTSPSSTGYEYWGGRGITICSHWRHSFENFYEDMGKKPGQGHEFSIDRIDVNGHYSCGHCGQCIQEGWTANCRWATAEEQWNNTRGNHYLEFEGERMTIVQWSRKLHMHRDALYYRIRAGWSVEKALTTPAKRYG